MPAVIVIASAPQNVTRTTAFGTPAPPAAAPMAPKREKGERGSGNGNGNHPLGHDRHRQH
jgi:hypothetical protein